MSKRDGLCNRTGSSLVEKYPECLEELKKWATSENRWLRRAAAVSLIIPVKLRLFLHGSFDISDVLVRDWSDMVQKGYSWLLKEASRQHQKDVFNYILRNMKRMPRTTLRYAIELMPKELEAEAMKRD